MIRTPTLAAVAAASLLTCGAIVAVAAPTSSAVPSSVPGPKQPIEHIGLSGGLFQNTIGEPGCFGSSGSKSASFPLPRGALVTGVTAYVYDSSTSSGIGVTLDRHDLASGGTYRLGNAFTTGAPGASNLEIELKPAVLLVEPSSVNVAVTIGKSVCFQGAEVHFIRNGAAGAQPTSPARVPEPTVTAAGPDGAPR